MKFNANLLTNKHFILPMVMMAVSVLVPMKVAAQDNAPAENVTNVFNITVNGDNNNIVIGDNNVVVNGENPQIIQEDKGVLTQEFEAVKDVVVQEPDVAPLYLQDKIGNLNASDVEEKYPEEYAFVLDLLQEQGDDQDADINLFVVVSEENFERLGTDQPLLDWVAASLVMDVAEGRVVIEPSAVQTPEVSSPLVKGPKNI